MRAVCDRCWCGARCRWVTQRIQDLRWRQISGMQMRCWLKSFFFFFFFVGVTPEMEILMQRRIYPFLLMVVLLIGILSFQIRQFKRLYEHIKNDKYIFRPLFVLICVFLVLFFLKWHLSLQISGWTETCQLRTEIRKSELSPALQPCCRVDFCPLLSHYVMFQLFFFFFF